MTTVNVIVNNGHTFSEGSCVICGASDPDYVPEPTEDTNIPDITLTALNEDGTAADGQGTDAGIAPNTLPLMHQKATTLLKICMTDQAECQLLILN